MQPDDTRARIVAAARALFTRGGEEATSLRAITREAGVNVAAVHYHFGGREGLLEAVLDQRIRPLNDRRLALLDAAASRAEGGAAPVEELIAAFVRPDLELLDELRRTGEVAFCRFMGRSYTQPSPTVAGFMHRQFEPVARRLLPMLAATLTHLDQAEIRLRIDLVVSVVTTLFATAPDASAPGPLGSDDVDEQVVRLVAFLAAGMAAPATLSRTIRTPVPSTERS